MPSWARTCTATHWIKAVSVGVDRVGYQVHSRCGHAPSKQPPHHSWRDSNRRTAQPFGRQIEPTNARCDPAPLDVLVPERMLSRDNRSYAGQPSGRAPVEARAVKVGVDHIETPCANEAYQPGQGRDVSVGPHADVVHDRALRPDRLGHASRIRQRGNLGVLLVSQQQAQLLLGASGGEAGDDVEDPHEAVPQTSRWRTSFANNRKAPSCSPT